MSLRIFSSTCSLGVLVLTSCLAGCGPTHSGEHGGGSTGGNDLGSAGGGGGGGGLSGDLSTGTPAPTSITISPNPALVNVTVTDGTVATMPLTFTASDENGNPITASWQLDKGEFGALTAGTGVFTANGLNAGTATVTATAGNVQATATLTITIASINTGANSGSGTGPQAPVDGGAPPGGYNGVGGVPLGGAPPATTVTVLQNGSGTDATFKFLYPYDGTVFPRGILPPLLQWSVPTAPTTFNATAIWVHLKQANYDFQGYYAGSNLVNAPIDAAAWTAATNSNGGDPLVVELKITDGTNVLGPLTQSWTIAPSRLRGTVYYNTYDSHLNTGTTNGSDGNGAVLAIQPGGFQPQLAIPSQLGKCYACHEVSADGSTLFTATTDANTNDGAVFDLKQSPPAQVSTYSGGTTGGMFTYGGIYPDGTMGLVSSQEDYHAYGGNSGLYAAASEAALSANGFSTLVTRAVTPAFSPDGAHAAFNFRTGTGVAGVVPGIGELAIMDFACGAPAGSVTCGAPPYNFSGLRQLFSAPANHYVGWPSFTPDSKMVAFQHTVTACTDGGSQLNTRSGAQAEIWLADAPAVNGTPRFAPQSLCAINGYGPDCTTKLLPTNANNHADDEQLNFEPNVTPIASGGYYWVVFTSRRLYGNVATTDPYFPVQGGNQPVVSPPTKKLWMAAIDPNPKASGDPSHPAFYLPGQEIMSGNMKAYWVNEPCHASGTSCMTGDECCTGYCSANGSGSLVCGDKPPGCVPEYSKCSTSADCCGTGLTCIDNLCTISPIS